MSSVAIVFDDTLRPETTGGYCRRALTQLVQEGRIVAIRHFLPQELLELRQQVGAWDLIVVVDDGLDYDLPQGVGPVAYWAIDTHLDFERSLRRSRQATWTFAAQKPGAERLRQQGVNAVWLPLACDPEFHGRQEVAEDYDWSFVGNIFPGERQRLIDLLQTTHPRAFVGRKYFTEMAAVYSSSKLVFNRSIADDLNMRVFEGLCSGSLLITNALDESSQAALFQDGVHLVTYRNDAELLRKFSDLLADDGQRQRIAAAGRAEVLSRHTYRHRMEQILEKTIPSFASARPQIEVTSQPSSNWLNEIDFGIKTFLRPQALLRLLRSIVEFYSQAPVTIVDDGDLATADDADSEACRALIAAQPQFRLISLPFAAGVSAGRNTLAAETSRPYLLILDDDFCFTAETKIECLWNRLQSDAGASVVAGVCEDWRQGARHRRTSGGTLERDGNTLIHRSTGWRDADRGQCDFVPHFALIRRDVFQEVSWRGGVGGEHYDFCLQLQERGYAVIQDDSVRIDHFPETPTLAGYAEYRHDYQAAEQEFLERWGLDRVMKDGAVICERDGLVPASIPQKSTDYFQFARPDVQQMVPQSARRILDLGCGAGRLGSALKARQSAHVTGVELNPVAAELARGCLDSVHMANLESDQLDFADGSFDCVICADILEHLRQPEIVLRKIRRWLTPAGSLIVSVPNVRNHTVVQSLLAGNWTYESAGLLDADHVRFFTRRELEKLLFRLGFDVGDLQMVPGDGYQAWTQQGRPPELNLNGLSIRASSEQDAAEFFAYQYLVRAVPATRPADKLTSIIVVTWNQLPYTQMCLDSLRLRTDEPYELIVIDNGSTDGTVEWLRAQPDVRLIENAENRGFPAAVNQGLQLARGENLLLLNNDTILTTAWLRRLLDVLHSDPRIGLVGPTSNCVGSAQQIPVDYRQLADLDGFAWDRRHRLLARGIPLTEDTDRLIGFCLLFKREVFDAIGLLDERFGMGCFEDDDFCRRAIAAGYRAVIARDSFVHHFGSVTFQGSGADLGAILQQNQRVYREKWSEADLTAETPRRGANESKRTDGGVEQRSDVPSLATVASPSKPRPAFLLSQDNDGNLMLEPNGVRLSGCLIVRNNETTIRPCLESLKPWVDELVVVDTGSTDATPQIAEELGARVFHWPWRDDFAAARNISLDHARGEWLFWMDSDDVISADCGRKLRSLADGEHPDYLLGYVMQVHCPGDDPHDMTVVDHVKLFRNRPELRFEFRIHEQILPAIRRAGGDVEFTDIYVVHAGSDRTKEGQSKKLERDFQLLNLELADRPDHPFVLFNLGMTHADCGQHVDAIRYLERCLQVSGNEESHVRKAYALLISSLMQSGQLDSATMACQRGRDIFPEDKELLFRQAMLQHQSGRLHEAVGTYRQLLEADEARHFTSVDTGISGFKARHNLALVYEDTGQYAFALKEWEQITEEQPDYLPGWRGRVEALLTLGRMLDVVQLCHQMTENPNAVLRNLAPYCRGRLAENHGEVDQALKEFERADQQLTTETDALRRICQLLFQAGRWHPAQESLARLAEHVPDDASVFHNLGIAQWHTGELAAARKQWERSLELRPGHSATMELLNVVSA